MRERSEGKDLFRVLGAAAQDSDGVEMRVAVAFTMELNGMCRSR